MKFNKLCKSDDAQQHAATGVTLFDYIHHHKLSDDFSQNYILPMCAAIWSMSIEDSKAFPLTFFLQFFNNHGLLNITDRPQWYTIMGGSREYIAPLTREFADSIKLNSPVVKVTSSVTSATGHTVHYRDEQVSETTVLTEEFDEVIFACHSDQALAMLATPTSQQQAVLSNIKYAMNDVVLHTDTNILPQRELAWASWNYLIKGDENETLQPATVTYNMNILQSLQTEHTFCVTLNNTAEIDPEKILGRYQYAHPQFSPSMVNAQGQRSTICGINNLHFCGAYWYNDFHEDGVRSALDVCARFGATL